MAETSKDKIKEIFDSIDKDNSGYLDYNEVLEAAKLLGQEMTKEDVDRVSKSLL